MKNFPLLCFRLGKNLNLSRINDSFSRRKLFSHESLRLETFIETRKNTANKIDDIEGFKAAMETKCEDQNNSLVFTEDLRKMVRLAENDNDISILFKLTKKFNSQQNVVRFGTYTVGPEIMRLYYILNKPHEALEAMRNPETTLIFKELSSFIILCDLLYENKMYMEVLEVFDLFSNKPFHKFPQNIIIVSFASCYKLNTPMALEKGKIIWTMCNEISQNLTVRAIGLYAALALNQGDLDLACEIISLIRKETTIGNNILVQIYSSQKNCSKVSRILNNMLYGDVNLGEIFLCTDTIDCIQKAYLNAPEEECMKLEKLLQELKLHKYITNKTLDDYLCEEINIAQVRKNHNSY
ncbi:hypothetical protein RUM44_000078 [Polyplax serrata]|uniref:Pentatricopeptide repeat-containing protein n=1 Tax=Polyplax serrata TaxID=468196 RepID=A0ABR1B4H3_POLSC